MIDKDVRLRRTEVVVDGKGRNQVVKYEVSLSSSVVLSLFFASLASVSALMAVLLMVMRPVLDSVQRASEQAEETGRDLERAAEEMERTALLFQNDLPLTMREVQKASEEFELVGKQLNVVFNSVTRPLREPVVEKALSSVTREAEKSTARFSRRIVRETTSVANNLWSSINQVASQLGLRGLSDEAVEEAKRLVYIGRQQQEARNWIQRWRMRTSMRESGRPEEEVASFSSLTGSGEWATMAKKGSSSAPYNDVGYSPSSTVEGEEQTIISRAVEALRENGVVDFAGQEDDPVAEVFTALARAQAAAEEAAVSSNALEKALAKAEESGMLSSSDEDDYGLAFDENEEVDL